MGVVHVHAQSAVHCCRQHRCESACLAHIDGPDEAPPLLARGHSPYKGRVISLAVSRLPCNKRLPPQDLQTCAAWSIMQDMPWCPECSHSRAGHQHTSRPTLQASSDPPFVVCGDQLGSVFAFAIPDLLAAGSGQSLTLSIKTSVPLLCAMCRAGMSCASALRHRHFGFVATAEERKLQL